MNEAEVRKVANGRSALLSASQDGLRRLLSNTQESIVQMFRD